MFSLLITIINQLHTLYFTLLFFTGYTLAGVQFDVSPENTAAFAGATVQLACRPPAMAPITMSWKEYVSGKDEGQIIFVEDTPANPPNPQIYAIARPEPRDYNLDIHLLTISGGEYTCEMLTPTQTKATASIIVFGEFSHQTLGLLGLVYMYCNVNGT